MDKTLQDKIKHTSEHIGIISEGALETLVREVRAKTIKDVEYWINDWWGEGQPYGIKGLIKRIRKI